MSIPKPRICPNPACPDPTRVGVGSKYGILRVECEGCGMSGPLALVRKNRTEAAELWNDIQRPPDRARAEKENSDGVL